MTITAHPTTRKTNGKPPLTRAAAGAVRSRPHLLVGVLLVVGCALVFYLVALRADTRSPVLVLTHDVAAGQTLQASDLAVAKVAADGSVAVIPDSDRATVIGQILTAPGHAQQLLTRAMLGGQQWPPPGQAVIAEPVTAGHLPDGAGPGSRVRVVMLPGNATTAETAEVSVEATITAIAEPDSTGDTVVSLLMANADAARIQGLDRPVAIVLLGRG